MELTAALIEARTPARVLPDRPAPSVPDDVLRRGADAVLAERRASGLWVFAYGALIWDDCYDCNERRLGTLHGMARRYCLRDTGNRGTPGRPSLTLGLEPADGACAGVVVHLAERGLERNLWAIWEHEMSGGLYDARWMQVATAEGAVDALTFVADPLNPLFAGQVPEDEAAAILASTAGPGGPAADYLRRTANAMREWGAPDPYLDRLAAAVADRLTPAWLAPSL